MERGSRDLGWTRRGRGLLAELREGIIALSGCASGEVARHILNGAMKEAQETIEWYRDTFGEGNYYLELQDNKLHSPYNEALREIGKQVGLPLVATNDCHYLHRDDAKAHEVLLCIQTGKTMSDTNRMRFQQPEFYLKSGAEMAARPSRTARRMLFSFIGVS